MSETPFWPTVRADVEATTHPNFRDHHSPAHFWARALVKLLVSANVRVVVMFRLAHLLHQRRLLPLALLLREWGIRSSGAELNPLASIGPGLYIPHSIGTSVGACVTIGRNCTLQAGACIGMQPFATQDEPARTVIGDDVYIGLHAMIIGGVTIGDGAAIGANAVVMRDVEPYTVVAASPARVVGTRPNAVAPPEG